MTLLETITFPDKRKSLRVIRIQETLMENKLNGLKPLHSRKKSFAFQKKLKKMLLPRRANLATGRPHNLFV